MIVLPKFKKIQTLTDNLNRGTRENLKGIRVVRAYNAEGFQEEKFEKVNIDLKNYFKMGLFIFSSVQELVRYSCAVFQLTNKIVKNNARTKNKLAEAFNDFLNYPYMSFLFMDEPFSTTSNYYSCGGNRERH